MKRIIFVLSLVFIVNCGYANKPQPTKNLIVMIPDGTSLSVLSASRWLKTYRQEGDKLHVDPYLSGTVTTFSSNAPIGDSAPTTSCYMTGVPQQPGNVAIYPIADPANDLVKLNPDSAYQPLATILEAMRLEQNKAVGLVVTCEFPHATPADCASHYYNRSNYAAIAPQMAYNNLSVMFGGGNSFVSEDMKNHFRNTGTTYLQNDRQGMLDFDGEKIWALYYGSGLNYEMDRDKNVQPTLAEMTEKALEILNKNENGFFLMVEGSQVDWAAHANDPAGMLGEFLAFDDAVGKAMEFAIKDGNTTVIVVPDHGNSGFSIGRNGLKKSYTKLSLKELFGNISDYQRSARGLEEILLKTKPEDFKSVFKQYTNLDLTDEQVTLLLGAKNYKLEDYTKATKGKNMSNYIAEICTQHTGFGFTTGGHTGEEVFLASYHPRGDILKGNVRNTELHQYLYDVAGLQTSLKDITSSIYAKHTDVFAGDDFSIIQGKDDVPTLVVKKKKKNVLEVPAFKSVVTINGKQVDIGSVVVYIDKNNTFYIPRNLKDLAFGVKK